MEEIVETEGEAANANPGREENQNSSREGAQSSRGLGGHPSSCSSSDNDDNEPQHPTVPNPELEMYRYFVKFYKPELDKILLIPLPKGNQWFPLEIDYIEMMGKCPQSIRLLQKSPDKAIEYADAAAAKALSYRFDKCKTDVDDASKTIKKTIKLIHARFCRLPNLPGTNLVRKTFPGTEFLGEFMTLEGRVTKITTQCILSKEMPYKCSKCKLTSIIKSDYITHDDLPAKLPGSKCTTKKCKGGSLSIIHQASNQINQDPLIRKPYQEITIEEMPHGAVGRNVKCMRIILEDDLVNSCIHYDDVAITGIFFVRHKPFKVNEFIDCEFAFKANHVKVKNPVGQSIDLSKEKRAAFDYFWKLHEGDPYYGRNLILKSICPKIYEMPIPKLALAITIAGGVSREVVKRAEGHLLFSGDPGTGKSELAKFATKLVPRSHYTTAVGTTTAGLTVSVVREQGGGWTMMPGAMVMANGGILVIDEFSILSRQNQWALNEGMEQQSVSLAKAGLVGTLPAKCSVIAASNPKKSSLKTEIDDKGIDKCLGLDSTMLSRFDLVILCNDTPDLEWDSMLCDKILWEDLVENPNPILPGESNLEWNIDDLRSYFAYIRGKTPELTTEANDVISKYYIYKRSQDSRHASRTTPRLYDSLIRLSDGHAKLMNQDSTMVSDVVVAISIMEAALESCEIIDTSKGCRLTRYPENPLEDYATKARKILHQIGMEGASMIENMRLSKLRKIQTEKKANPPPPPPPPPRFATQVSSVSNSLAFIPESHPIFTINQSLSNREDNIDAAAAAERKESERVNDEAAWKDFFMSDEERGEGRQPIIRKCAVQVSPDNINKN